MYYFLASKALPDEEDTLCMIKVPNSNPDQAATVAFEQEDIGEIYIERKNISNTCYLISEKDLTPEYLKFYKGYVFVFKSEDEMNELYSDINNYDYGKHIKEHMIEVAQQVFPGERLH